MKPDVYRRSLYLSCTITTVDKHEYIDTTADHQHICQYNCIIVYVFSAVYGIYLSV